MTLVYGLIRNPRDGSPWASRTIGVRLMGARDVITPESQAYGYRTFKTSAAGVFVMDLPTVPGQFYIIAYPDQTNRVITAELTEPPHTPEHLIPTITPDIYGWELSYLVVNGTNVTPVPTPTPTPTPIEFGVLTVEPGQGVKVDKTNPHHPVVSLDVELAFDGAVVTGFNGRSGPVTPQDGDYTAAQVGAEPAGTVATALNNFIQRKNVLWVQTEPSSHWVIDHGLGVKPQVTIIDSANRKVEGDISYPSNDVVIIDFGAQFSGTAELR